MIDFRIETFLAVCRCKNFSRAAERLHITQPAVSQHIKYLEEELGRPLFETKGKTFRLSPAGMRLYRYAQSVEADSKRVSEQIKNESDLIPFRFGATKTIGEFILPESVGDFLKENPTISITMTVDNSSNLISALQEGVLDFAFIEGMLDREDFLTEVFFTDSFIPVCSPENSLARGIHSFSEILEGTVIVRERGSGSRMVFENALASRNCSFNEFSRMIEIGSIGAIKDLVAADAGIAFLYRASVKDALDNGKIVQINLADFSIRHDYSFVYLKNRMYADRYHDFLSFCRSHSLRFS